MVYFRLIFSKSLTLTDPARVKRFYQHRKFTGFLFFKAIKKFDCETIFRGKAKIFGIPSKVLPAVDPGRRRQKDPETIIRDWINRAFEHLNNRGRQLTGLGQ
jgi:hypothetical protein